MVASIKKLVEWKGFRATVMGLILINSAMIGAETYDSVMKSAGTLLHVVDRVILYIFGLELLLRFIATSPKRSFFFNGWNLFDLIVVGAGFVPGGEYLSVLRLLRIIRILRAVTVLPQLQKMVVALLRSLPSLGNVIFLLALLFYAYGAAGTYLFREADPDHFGSLHQSVLTLFGVVTLEGWVGIMDTVIKKVPWSWTYFITFIVLGTFVSMNLFVGVIVNNMQKADEEREVAAEEATIAALARIEEKLARLEARSGLDGPPASG